MDTRKDLLLKSAARLYFANLVRITIVFRKDLW